MTPPTPYTTGRFPRPSRRFTVDTADIGEGVKRTREEEIIQKLDEIRNTLSDLKWGLFFVTLGMSIYAFIQFVWG